MSLLSWLKGKNQLVKTKIQSEVRTTIKPGQADVDRTIIEQLRNAGLDLSASFHIRYLFTAPTRDSAHQLAQELRARGLHPELTEEGGRWKIAAPEDVVVCRSMGVSPMCLGPRLCPLTGKMPVLRGG